MSGTRGISTSPPPSRRTGARFVGTSLKGAALRKAKLARAQIEGADFSCADLTEARLSYVCFRNATLTGAIFMGAVVEPLIGDANLARYDSRKFNFIGSFGYNLVEYDASADPDLRQRRTLPNTVL